MKFKPPPLSFGARVFSYRGFSRVFALLAIVTMTFFAVVAISSSAAFADENDDKKKNDPNFSFYSLAESLADFYSDRNSPYNPDTGNVDPEQQDKNAPSSGDEVRAANRTHTMTFGWYLLVSKTSMAGDFFGYTDSKDTSGWIQSLISGSSNQVSYDGLLFEQRHTSGSGGSDPAGITSASYSGPSSFASYGALLNAIGLDESVQGGLSFHFSHQIIGSLLQLSYLASSGVEFFFKITASALYFFNPFRFLFSAVENTTNLTLARDMIGDKDATQSTVVPEFIKALPLYIASIYRVMRSLSIIFTLPIILLIFVCGLVFSEKYRSYKWTKFKLVAIRFLYVGVGVPLLGSLYSAALDSLTHFNNSGASLASTRAIASTLVDFNSWMLHTRLAPPYVNAAGGPHAYDLAWNFQTHQPLSRTVANVRNTALAINKNSIPELGGVLGSDDQIKLYNKKYESSSSSATSSADYGLDGTTATQDIRSNDGGDLKGDYETYKKARDAVSDMVSRYIGGDTLSAAEYETSMQTAIVNEIIRSSSGSGLASTVNRGMMNYPDAPTGLSASEANDRVTHWFKDFQAKPDDLNKISGEFGPDNHTARVVLNRIIYINPDSSLKTDPIFDGNNRVGYAYSQGGAALNNQCDRNLGDGCGLSPLAAYNYLNISFDTKGMTIYSSAKTSSESSRKMHSQVSLIGQNLIGKMVYAFSTMITLLSFTILALVYSVGLLLRSFFRSFRAISTIMAASLGIIAAINKSIMIAIGLSVEILITLFIFRVVQEFLLIIPAIIEAPSSLFSGATTAGHNIDGSGKLYEAYAAGGIVTTLVTSFVMMAFTISAMRLRGQLVRGVDEFIATMLSKFTEAPAAPAGSGPNIGGAIGAGAGGAASMMAAGRFLKKNEGKGQEDQASEKQPPGNNRPGPQVEDGPTPQDPKSPSGDGSPRGIEMPSQTQKELTAGGGSSGGKPGSSTPSNDPKGVARSVETSGLDFSSVNQGSGGGIETSATSDTGSTSVGSNNTVIAGVGSRGKRKAGSAKSAKDGGQGIGRSKTSTTTSSTTKTTSNGKSVKQVDKTKQSSTSTTTSKSGKTSTTASSAQASTGDYRSSSNKSVSARLEGAGFTDRSEVQPSALGGVAVGRSGGTSSGSGRNNASAPTNSGFTQSVLPTSSKRGQTKPSRTPQVNAIATSSSKSVGSSSTKKSAVGKTTSKVSSKTQTSRRAAAPRSGGVKLSGGGVGGSSKVKTTTTTTTRSGSSSGGIRNPLSKGNSVKSTTTTRSTSRGSITRSGSGGSVTKAQYSSKYSEGASKPRSGSKNASLGNDRNRNVSEQQKMRDKNAQREAELRIIRKQRNAKR